jgi:hypothetical protein
MVTRADGSKKKIRTGISISQTELCAADLRLRDSVDRAWRVPLEPPQSENGGHWPSLASGLAELARTLGVTEGTLAVSLMPPLTEVRRLELPPIRDDELQLILARSASKYFVGARTPQVVGASFASKKRVRGAPAQVVAAAAPARLIASLRHAAQQTGWTMEVISPAENAWAAAALAMWPIFARQSAFALVAHTDRTDLLQIDDGRLVNVRRFRAGSADATMILDTVGPSARVGLMGEPGSRRQLGAALSSLGITPTLPAGEWTSAADRPEVLAAHFAGAEIGPALRSEDTVVQERATLARTTWRVAVAAAALFVAAAAIELWGVHRQLGIVRAEREKIRPQIASTMVGRTTVDAAYRHLTALAAIERKSPHWSTVIATLTDAIPEDAFLLAVRTRDDSVIVDGLAQRARRVFDALEQANGLTGVRAAAPVRRELQDGGAEALEHFAIAARVVPETTKVSPVSNAARRQTP